VKHTLHITAAGSELHLALPDGADSEETLALCAEGLRNGRVIEFPDLLPPGGVARSPVLVNFALVVSVWVSTEQ
jgi:hypothetical protein